MLIDCADIATAKWIRAFYFAAGVRAEVIQPGAPGSKNWLVDVSTKNALEVPHVISERETDGRTYDREILHLEPEFDSHLMRRGGAEMHACIAEEFTPEQRRPGLRAWLKGQK